MMVSGKRANIQVKFIKHRHFISFLQFVCPLVCEHAQYLRAPLAQEHAVLDLPSFHAGSSVAAALFDITGFVSLISNAFV